MFRFPKIAAPALAATLAATAAIAVAAPASAAHIDNSRFDTGRAQRTEIAQLDRQVDAALYRHQIDRREAAQLGTKVDRLEVTWRQYARGGFTRGELKALDARIDQVKWQLAKEIRDGKHDSYGRDTDREGNAGYPTGRTPARR
ncbi:MAG: hypothetical protein IE933_10110 [Sphingomonadales bacterium]|nr:hypothetical protein [Sphingomonadales bacterium]MBD3773311.1 hypothetical protein [Paracoccaceae bacterium]